MDELDALDERVLSAVRFGVGGSAWGVSRSLGCGFGGFGRRERAVEVVDRGQQLLGELDHASGLRAAAASLVARLR